VSVAADLRRVMRGEIRESEPLSRHTSLKVGGPADLFLVPEDVDDLRMGVSVLDAAGVPRMTIGGGYNLLVRDGGIRGAVISLARLNRVAESGERLIRAEAGADNIFVVRFAQGQRLGGIGFIAGIPGTIGGAASMNAGAYGKGILERAEALTLLRRGGVVEIPMAELDFGYRRVSLLPGDVVVAVTLRLEEMDPAETEEEVRRDLELRRTKHATGYPSAGSFFKNPPEGPAWKLIDRAGLRGTKIGGAMVSEVHANFLVNAGGATARDFLELAAQVKREVREVSGVDLEAEVRLVGEE
jgi:UDP-N-acetylmuramate dehydrogenase